MMTMMRITMMTKWTTLAIMTTAVIVMTANDDNDPEILDVQYLVTQPGM